MSIEFAAAQGGEQHRGNQHEYHWRAGPAGSA